jgi:ubiquinone/menaquinone biosynthesis C-methylase UbiE
MADQLLNYLGNSHASYIHSRGKQSTNKLIELLNPQKGEKILEIGFGTGATLVQLAAQSDASFFGYEMSPIMYQKASKRIKFCKMSGKITVTLLKKKNQFPAPDNTFDQIYAESIIAIQEGTDFKDLLLEIKRVLKPNGVLLFNETIWLKTTDKKQAKAINERCKKAFGIIQSSHEYLHLSDWKNLLTEINFKYELEIPVSEIRATEENLSQPILCSKIYTLMGKMKAALSPSMRKKWKTYTLEMASIVNKKEQLMEGIISKAYNIK